MTIISFSSPHPSSPFIRVILSFCRGTFLSQTCLTSLAPLTYYASTHCCLCCYFLLPARIYTRATLASKAYLCTCHARHYVPRAVSATASCTTVRNHTYRVQSQPDPLPLPLPAGMVPDIPYSNFGLLTGEMASAYIKSF